MLQKSAQVKVDPIKEEISKLHDAVKDTPRTDKLEPEQDPKFLHYKKIQEDYSYVIKLNRAPIEEKIDLLQSRIKALDENAADYFDKIKKENDLYHKITENPLSQKELVRREELLAKSIQSEAAASNVLKEAYQALKGGDSQVAEERFKLSDQYLEKGIAKLFEK